MVHFAIRQVNITAVPIILQTGNIRNAMSTRKEAHLDVYKRQDKDSDTNHHYHQKSVQGFRFLLQRIITTLQMCIRDRLKWLRY